MMSYTEQLQRVVDKYQKAGQPWPATARQIAEWAFNNGQWHPQPSALITQCADELSRAMREEYITDPQGRTIRAKHVAKMERGGEQTALWADIRSAGREHMEVAFQQRRQQIVGDCRQLKTDIDSYNENYNSGEALQMVFDFSLDLAEGEALESKRQRTVERVYA